MKRVLVDLLFFTGKKGGMESYARELYSRLSRDDPDFEFVGLASSELAASDTSWFPGRVVATRTSGENRIAWAFGELFTVARHARRQSADLVHAPANFGPWRSAVPVVLTVQDLLAFRHPEFIPGGNSRIVRAMIRLAARAARRVLTTSRATRDDIVSFLGVPAEHVDVIPLAASDSTTRDLTRERAQLLSVGNRMPHKGFETVLEALALIPADRRPDLVITGSHGDDPLAPVVERLGLGDHVTLRGWLTPADLDRLYRESTAFVFPSRFEGFGLPPLEAMVRGCPVIVSDIPVLHEVAGDAAVYVEPGNAEAFAAAIVSLLDSPGEQERMSRAGRARATEYSWERTAAATRASFAAALDPADLTGR